jgi:hypothetical protein
MSRAREEIIKLEKWFNAATITLAKIIFPIVL